MMCHYLPQVENVEDKDWIQHVQSTWKPQIIGDLTILFPWHNAGLSKTSKKLVLEGGAAFGTGDHPTTRLCCRWLEKILSKKELAENLTLLDYGCGSAILGLAALKYGAYSASGVDIDADALCSARNNCELNNLDMDLYITMDTDTPEAWPTTPSNGKIEENFKSVSEINGRFFDIIVANILAPTLLVLLKELASKTGKGGYIGVSGIVNEQSEKIISHYSKYFDSFAVESTEEGWVLLTGKRNEVPIQ